MGGSNHIRIVLMNPNPNLNPNPNPNPDPNPSPNPPQRERDVEITSNPIHDQLFFLDGALRRRLRDEYGIQARLVGGGGIAMREL